MQTQKFLQTMKDGTEIAVNRWIPDDETKIKGIIQLSHGMQEHALRYDRIGCILADEGFVFSAHDHRGHGKTAVEAQKTGKGTFQKLADKDGFNKVVDDLDQIIDELKKDYPDKPVILFGHSFGSFVSQAYIERNGSKLNGCVLCGSKGPDMMAAKAGHAMANLMCFFGKKNKQSKFMQNLAFAGYNDRFKDEKDELSWLSRSATNRAMYKSDSWCGGIATVSFFRDLTWGLKTIHKAKNMKKIPHDLPIFIIYGEDDPVGKYGSSLQNLYKIYTKNGIKSVNIKCYAKDRHEILNEEDGETVLKDVITWINSIIVA